MPPHRMAGVATLVRIVEKFPTSYDRYFEEPKMPSVEKKKRRQCRHRLII